VYFSILYLAKSDASPLNKSVENLLTKPTSLLRVARSNRLQIASSYSRWIAEHEWHVALTLNFDSDVSKHAATRAARTYWHRFDLELFGSNAVQRRGLRLPRACFIEGETGVRNWHYHAAIQLPMKDCCRLDPAIAGSPERFGALLLERWDAMREAGRYSKAEPIYDVAGWATYISKDVGKGECELCTVTSHFHDDRDTM
jgi:hypothetical protein